MGKKKTSNCTIEKKHFTKGSSAIGENKTKQKKTTGVKLTLKFNNVASYIYLYSGKIYFYSGNNQLKHTICNKIYKIPKKFKMFYL